jgi:hypothetical protein
MTHHNQTNVLITWFLNLSLDEYIDNTKTQSLNFESKTHEAQLKDQKPKKNPRRTSRRMKNHKASKSHKERQAKENGKKGLRKAQNQDSDSKLSLKKTPSSTLNATSPP